MIAQIYSYVYIQCSKAEYVFTNNQAYVLHIYEYVCTVSQWRYIHMSAHAYMNICFCWFVLSILSIVWSYSTISRYNICWKIWFYFICIYIFTWWWTSSHASSWVTHLTGMILVQYSRLLSDLFCSNCVWNCWRLYMFYCIAWFYCTLS